MVNKTDIPKEFKYREVLLKGRPKHDRLDGFYGKHPPMPAQRWAKIFSPFDALKGFDVAIAAAEASYKQKFIQEEDVQSFFSG